jgi:hypothetical protein
MDGHDAYIASNVEHARTADAGAGALYDVAYHLSFVCRENREPLKLNCISGRNPRSCCHLLHVEPEGPQVVPDVPG